MTPGRDALWDWPGFSKKKRKVSVCTITETVICEMVSIHTSKPREFGFRKLVHEAGWEPCDRVSFPVHSPQPHSVEELTVPGAPGAVPSVLVKCKYDPFWYKLQLQSCLSPFFVSLDRGNSMPPQQYWQTGKMKASSLESGSLSRAESSRRTLQRWGSIPARSLCRGLTILLHNKKMCCKHLISVRQSAFFWLPSALYQQTACFHEG